MVVDIGISRRHGVWQLDTLMTTMKNIAFVLYEIYNPLVERSLGLRCIDIWLSTEFDTRVLASNLGTLVPVASTRVFIVALTANGLWYW